MDVWQEEEWGVVMRWEYAPPIDVIQFEKYWGLLGSMRNPLHYQRLGAMKCKWWFMGRINPLAGQIMHFPFRPRYVITQSTSDRTFWLGMRTFPHTTSWVHNLLSLSGCYYYFSATCYPPPWILSSFRRTTCIWLPSVEEAAVWESHMGNTMGKWLTAFVTQPFVNVN